MGETQTREAVGLFHDENKLQDACDELLINGFNHADLSLLAADRTIETRLGSKFERVADLEDNPGVAFQAFVDSDSRTEGKGVLVGGLFYIGAMAAAGAVVASGGAIAALVLGVAAGGGAGGLIGVMLARFLEKHHAHALQEHLDKGGLLLWVHTPDEAHERTALEILRRCGAEDAHVHSLPTPDYSAAGGVSKQLSFIRMIGL
ncbi:MAG TPA: hypothetical protein VFE34_05970 [Dongiaceae bacterium]|jgi:hypothetical protein|nr:hypothetical protein [Dongiaceae bacterium]